MGAIEAIAVLLGVANGFILVVRPVSRIHSRIDSLDYQVASVAQSLHRIEKRLEYEIDRLKP